MENKKNNDNYHSSMDDNRHHEQQRSTSRYEQKDNISIRDFSQHFPESGAVRDQRNLHSQRDHQRGPEGYRRSDERIREVISDLLSSNDDLDTRDFEVRVNEASVTLRGYIPDEDSRRKINEVVERVPGIKKVNDELRVNPHARE